MEKSGVKILLVDDEEDILEALQTHLELDGYDVECVTSGKEGLEKVKDKAFHIVMTDINMPEMDGIELLERLKQLRGETIVIMITAYTSLMKVLNSRIYGAADYVLKPFRDLSEVDDVISRAHMQIERWNKVLSETRNIKKKKSESQ